jgi:hypothetical protein
MLKLKAYIGGDLKKVRTTSKNTFARDAKIHTFKNRTIGSILLVSDF